MKQILIFTLLLSMSAFSAPEKSLRSEILSTLPGEISKLSERTGLSELQKKFSKKIKKAEEDALYLNYFTSRNDITIGLEDKHFRYAFIKVPAELAKQHLGLFKKVYDSLSPSEQRNLLSSGNISHESGRYLHVDLPKQSVSLRFRNNANKDLESILFWDQGENKP